MIDILHCISFSGVATESPRGFVTVLRMWTFSRYSYINLSYNHKGILKDLLECYIYFQMNISRNYFKTPAPLGSDLVSGHSVGYTCL